MSRVCTSFAGLVLGGEPSLLQTTLFTHGVAPSLFKSVAVLFQVTLCFTYSRISEGSVSLCWWELPVMPDYPASRTGGLEHRVSPPLYT